jgi:hypothetical protein
MSRNTFVRLVAFAILAILFFISPPPSHADQPPRVFAFYYAWFDENAWSPNLVSDIPAQPYTSGDPAVIARQIDQALGAGIDSFVVSWLGPGNPTDDRFKMMLDIAGGKNFSATIDFEAEQYGSRDALVNALTYVRDNLEPHGTFARVNGKPILFFWREQARSVDEWAAIRSAVDPNHDQIWIAEGVNLAYQRVFDGQHLYSIAWSPDVNHTLNDWAQRVRRAGADKLWVATVMPGYDDTRTTRADKFARSRENGNFYRATWNAALASRPDLIVITSFNEWVEGSQIEPSVSYGNQYLDLTREYAAQFKSSPPPSAEEKSALAATATPRPPTPTATSSTRVAPPTPTPPNETTVPFPDAYRTTDILRVRSGPGTTYETIGKLPPAFVLDVLGRSQDNQWLAIAYPDFGSLGWVSAAFVIPQSGLEQFPVEPAPGQAASTPTPSSEPTDALPDWY